MPRIRTLKPELPQSESMGRVSRDARLTFILLWTLADDAGRLRGNSRMLASLLYPYDDDARGLMDAWLTELEREDCIQRYQVDGDSFVQIANWLKHQKIDKPSPSKLPPFAEASANPREASRILPVGRDLDLDLDRERKGSLHADADASGAPPPSAAGAVPRCPIDEIIGEYHATLPQLPRVLVRNETRDGYIRARWRDVFAQGKAKDRDDGLELFREFFAHCRESKFLTGQATGRNGSPPFVADLEWLMKPTNFAKAVEGRYHRG
jgi:hypothetical protein